MASVAGGDAETAESEDAANCEIVKPDADSRQTVTPDVDECDIVISDGDKPDGFISVDDKSEKLTYDSEQSEFLITDGDKSVAVISDGNDIARDTWDTVHGGNMLKSDSNSAEMEKGNVDDKRRTIETNGHGGTPGMMKEEQGMPGMKTRGADTRGESAGDSDGRQHTPSHCECVGNTTSVTPRDTSTTTHTDTQSANTDVAQRLGVIDNKDHMAESNNKTTNNKISNDDDNNKAKNNINDDDDDDDDEHDISTSTDESFPSETKREPSSHDGRVDAATLGHAKHTPQASTIKAEPHSDHQLHTNPVSRPSLLQRAQPQSTDLSEGQNTALLSARGMITGTLPETRHPGILHTGNHTSNGHSHTTKKLEFQIPNAPKHPHENLSTDTSEANASVKKMTRSLTFPSLSKLRHKQPKELAESVKTVDVVLAPEKPRGSKPGFWTSGSKEGCGRRCCSPLTSRLKKWWNRDVTIEGKEIRNTVAVGVAFQLIFTANFAIQNLQSSLHEEEYLGVSALGCLYATSIFSSIFAPTIIGVLGTKGCLVLAWAMHILYTLAQFYPAWETLVPASIMLGAITGPTWTAQGVYVSACAFSFSKRSPHSPYTILSRFNGLFFTLYETRQILGNLLSSVLLQDGVGNKSQEVIFKFCGPRDCPYSENVTDIEEPDSVVITSMLAIYVALQVLALALTVLLVTPLSRGEWSSRAPVRQTVTSWFRTLVGTRMIFFVPFMVFQAMEQGLLLSEYTKSYISCPIGIHMVGFVMATHGATSAVFVFVFSRLARRTGRYPLFALAAVLSLACLIVLFDWTPSSDQQPLIFVFPVLWGIGEGIWQTQTNSMIAVTFWDRKEPAFANYQTWRAVGFTFVFSFHSVLCVSTKIAVTLGFLVVGMLLYSAVELYTRWKERRRVPKNDPNQAEREAEAAVAAEVEAGNSLAGESSDHSPKPLPRSWSSPGFAVSGPLDIEITIARPPDTGGGQGRGGEEGGGGGEGTLSRLSSCLSFDGSETETDGQLTLDGTFLTRGETAFLDNDLKRYGVVPTGGSRPLTVATLTSLAKNGGGGEEEPAAAAADRWGASERDDYRNGGNAGSANQRRPHSWHDSRFQDEGELQVVWTKHDVFVY